jgi:hypothetical protein
MRRQILAVAALLSMAGATPRPVDAQHRRDEQFYYPGSFNWKFLTNYPEAARLFNVFDYGHAILYERLYTLPDSVRAAAALKRAYRYLTTDLLVRPPRYAVAEEVIEPAYAKLAWQAMRMFDGRTSCIARSTMSTPMNALRQRRRTRLSSASPTTTSATAPMRLRRSRSP